MMLAERSGVYLKKKKVKRLHKVINMRKLSVYSVLKGHCLHLGSLYAPVYSV